MRIDAIMTSPVITVPADADVAVAAQLMLDHHISGLPVVDPAGNLVGIVSEGDFLRRGELKTERQRPRWLEFLIRPGRLADEYVHAFGRKVGDVMTPEAVAARSDMSVADAVVLMERHDIKRLPVVDDGKLVGIVTRADLLRGMLGNRPAVGGGTDAEILAAIRAELARHPWGGGSGLVRASCNAGIVTLEGTIFDERERTAIRVAVENIGGVREIRDQMVTIEPISGAVIANPADPSLAPPSDDAA